MLLLCLCLLNLLLDSLILMSYTCSQSPQYCPFLSSDKIHHSSTCQQATEQLENASREKNPVYTLMLSSELANESLQMHIHNAAALALKNNLSAHIQYTTRWLSLDNDTKAKIKQEVLVILASPLLRAGGFAQVVTAIASIEFLHDQWPDLIELVLLLSFMNNLTNTNLRIMTLQMIGYICESILAAVHALYNSLEFMHKNFKREGECNHIMQVMASYMEQAIFMTADYGELPEVKSKFFAKIALPEVNPVLLSLLTLQEEVVNENEWNMSMSVGTYFNFMAWAVTDLIVDTVIPFIEAYIKSPNRHQWEATMMALWVYPGWFRSKHPDRIHGLLIATIKPDAYLHPLVPALVMGVQDNLRTLEFLEEESVPSQTSHLSPYFDGIVNTLLRVTDTHPEHVDNYFDVGAARNAVRATVILQCVAGAYLVAGEGYSTYGRLYHDSHPAAHSDCRTNLQTFTVLEDAFLAVVWLASDSSIDLHTPLLHLMPGYHMPNDSYAGHTPIAKLQLQYTKYGLSS
ncbi:armadillo-type protein [Pisolithus thermaeus]|nr:armadillo-type protein [Pisolithus thermaeus]